MACAANPIQGGDDDRERGEQRDDRRVAPPVAHIVAGCAPDDDDERIIGEAAVGEDAVRVVERRNRAVRSVIGLAGEGCQEFGRHAAVFALGVAHLDAWIAHDQRHVAVA